MKQSLIKLILKNVTYDQVKLYQDYVLNCIDEETENQQILQLHQWYIVQKILKNK